MKSCRMPGLTCWSHQRGRGIFERGSKRLSTGNTRDCRERDIAPLPPFAEETIAGHDAPPEEPLIVEERPAAILRLIDELLAVVPEEFRVYLTALRDSDGSTAEIARGMTKLRDEETTPAHVRSWEQRLRTWLRENGYDVTGYGIAVACVVWHGGRVAALGVTEKRAAVADTEGNSGVLPTKEFLRLRVSFHTELTWEAIAELRRSVRTAADNLLMRTYLADYYSSQYLLSGNSVSLSLAWDYCEQAKSMPLSGTYPTWIAQASLRVANSVWARVFDWTRQLEYDTSHERDALEAVRRMRFLFDWHPGAGEDIFDRLMHLRSGSLLHARKGRFLSVANEVKQVVQHMLARHIVPLVTNPIIDQQLDWKVRHFLDSQET